MSEKPEEKKDTKIQPKALDGCILLTKQEYELMFNVLADLNKKYDELIKENKQCDKCEKIKNQISRIEDIILE